jgi:hypothetical protein
LDEYGSVSAMVRSSFPEHNVIISKYLSDKVLHRWVFDNVGKNLGVQRWEDWYSKQWSDISDTGAREILTYYGNSLVKALLAIYDDHPWKLKNFKRIKKRLIFW